MPDRGVDLSGGTGSDAVPRENRSLHKPAAALTLNAPIINEAAANVEAVMSQEPSGCISLTRPLDAS